MKFIHMHLTLIYMERFNNLCSGSLLLRVWKLWFRALPLKTLPFLFYPEMGLRYLTWSGYNEPQACLNFNRPLLVNTYEYV